MKKILTGLALLSGMTAAAQDKLEFTAEVGGVPDGTVVRIMRPLGNSATDSAYSKDGKFKATIDMSEGGSTYIIQFGDALDQNHGLFMYLDKGKLNIKSESIVMKNAQVTGSSFVDDWKTIERELLDKTLSTEKLNKLEEQYAEAMQLGDKESMAQFAEQQIVEKEALSKIAHEWLVRNPDLPAASYVVNAFMSTNNRIKWKALMDEMGPKLKGTFTIKYMNSLMTRDSNEWLTRIGQKLPEISLKDKNGKTVNLSDLQGKVVLIDFWASWCKPCRAQAPRLAKLYEKYKDQGFEILGVSIDDDQNKWKQAISEDKMTWMQLIGEKGKQSKVMADYKITGVPRTLLVSSKGLLVQNNPAPEKLEELVEFLLDQK